MEKLFEIATKISSPIALGGLFAVIFFYVIKQILAKNIFPTLTKISSYNVLKTIIDRFFVLALIAMILGFLGYIIPIILPAISSQKSSSSLPQASLNEPPKFRVRYFDVAGYGIDFLMKGMVDEKMEKDLSGQPFIVPNEVFNETKYLMENFSQPTDVPNLRDSKDNWLEMEVKGKYLGIIDIDFSTEANQLILSSFESERDWNLPWKGDEYDKRKYIPELKEGKINANYLLAWKFIDKKYLNLFRENKNNASEINLYKFVTKRYLPYDFSILILDYNPCPDGVWEIRLVNRIPILKVAVVENITKGPISIGPFVLKKNLNKQLLERSYNNKMLAGTNSSNETLFPLKILAQEEKILIPLELYFAYNKWNKNIIKMISESKIPNELRKIQNFESINIIEESNRNYIHRIKKISFNNLKNLFNKKAINAYMEKEFIYGASIVIEQISVDGKLYPFRKFDEKTFILHSMIEQGSCPYAYTYSPETKQWLNEGHILYGKSSKRREGWDSIKLKRFTGKVIIKENDPEVSFIDLLRIRVKNTDRKEQVLLPKQAVLRSEDQQYLTMKQGDQTEVEFDGFQENADSTFYLESKGYYEVK